MSFEDETLPRLHRLVCELERRIREALRDSGTSLTKIFGIGPLLAAKIIGRVGSVARFPSEAHFASYTDTAPIEASSRGVSVIVFPETVTAS